MESLSRWIINKKEGMHTAVLYFFDCVLSKVSVAIGDGGEL